MAVFSLLFLVACGDDRNKACEQCDNDDDCETGLSCLQFVDQNTGNIFTRCGGDDPLMTCPIR